MSEENGSKNKDEKNVYEITNKNPEAIVIYCSDPRFQTAFEKFVEEELKLKKGTYVPMVIAGGIVSLSEQFQLPKEFKFIKERIEYFLDHMHSIKLVVLINHEDCQYYNAIKNKLGDIFLREFGDMVKRQKVDLLKVAKAVMSFSSLQKNVKLYYAKFVSEEKKQIAFEEINL